MSEEQSVEAVVHLYVDGMALAHAGALRKAFHPKASIIGNYRGEVEWLSLNEFIDAVSSEGATDNGSKTLIQIEAIDVTGDAATVKVVDEFAGMRFSDYLSLLKVDGRWLIVSKVYYLHS
ncbi:nuclear transport factor 2 family protein [Neorhizobium sp. NCHU2750]|uniref:nuclear transport factor 2 family protein n=1 Tax=Neorhizobium sp. NCHU2750 TaxID=1825976 RepID=UPI000E724202|nr:hypothetical protein NCHU2750_40340 [Neorhizobium sp. NCHU2750]